MGVPQVMSSLRCCLKLHCSQWIQMSLPLAVCIFSLWKQSQSGSKSPNLVLQTYQCEGLGYSHGVLNYSISHESWLVVSAGWVTQKEVSPTYKKEITRIGDLQASSHWGGNSRLFLWSHIAKTKLRCFHALGIRTVCVLMPPDHAPYCGSPLIRRWSHDFCISPPFDFSHMDTLILFKVYLCEPVSFWLSTKCPHLLAMLPPRAFHFLTCFMGVIRTTS